MKKTIRSIITLLVLLLAVWLQQNFTSSDPKSESNASLTDPNASLTDSNASLTDSNAPLTRTTVPDGKSDRYSRSPPSPVAIAFADRKSDVVLEDTGTIEKVLPDDRKGSRHQRLIVEISDGLTILIAHNIDLAPRLPNPRPGQKIRFKGEYEWTDRGGVIHWTHLDPKKWHEDGWIDYQGQRYQ